jgi:hypothetical protein
MPKKITPKGEEVEQITFRVPVSWIKTFDKFAEKFSAEGLRLTRTHAFRMAMAEGIKVLDKKAGPS